MVDSLAAFLHRFVALRLRGFEAGVKQLRRSTPRWMRTTPRRPTRVLVLTNFVVFQGTWLAAVFAAAQCMPGWSIFYVACAITWHLTLAEQPWQEAGLIGISCVAGWIVESLLHLSGHVQFACQAGAFGQVPWWLVSMWGLFAICLNVSLRWLRGRWLLIPLLGAVGGPFAFAAGVRMGAAQFLNPSAALMAIAIGWCVALPALVWTAERLDGFRFMERQP